MLRRTVGCAGGAILLGLAGAACTAPDQAVPSTPAAPVEFVTLPTVTEIVTTEVTEPLLGPIPSAPPAEPALVTIDGQIPAAVDAFRFAAPAVVDFVGLPLTDLAVSPSGAWFAVNRGTEICLLDPSTGSESSEEGCVEVARPIAPSSLAWSPDESAVAFTYDWPEEPDIGLLDVASRSWTVLIEDRATDAATTDYDVAPFFSEDGTLHFLRVGSDPFPVDIIESGDTPITIGSLEAQGLPFSARRDPVGGAVVVEVVGSAFHPSIETIDLVEATSTLIAGELDGINRYPFLDVAGGRALIGQEHVPGVDGTRAALIDLRGDARPRAVPSTPADSGRGVVGVGLSPDGTAIMMIIADARDPLGHQLVVAPIFEDGTVGPLGVIATGEQFAPNGGDPTIRPQGLGVQREILWTSEKIVFGLGPNRIITLDLDN